MNKQNEIMILDADVDNIDSSHLWVIYFEYGDDKHYLRMDNDFNQDEDVLLFQGKSDAMTYLKILQGNINA